MSSPTTFYLPQSASTSGGGISSGKVATLVADVAAINGVLAAATPVGTPATLTKRNEAGGFEVGAPITCAGVPIAIDHLTNKDYVDSAITASTTTIASGIGSLETRMTAAETSLSGATSSATNNALVKRSATGGAALSTLTTSTMETTSGNNLSFYTGTNTLEVYGGTAAAPTGNSLTFDPATNVLTAMCDDTTPFGISSVSGVINTDSIISCPIEPTASSHLANKAYVDALANGLTIKEPVRLATTAALPSCTYSAGVLTASANGALSVDSVATALNDRLLIKNQASALQNGLYYVSTLGTAGVPFALTRVHDADVDAEVTTGCFCFVIAGTTNANIAYVLTTVAPITVGTTDLTFVPFSSAASVTLGGDISGSSGAASVNSLRGGAVTVPASGTLATLATAQTLTNKTMTGETNTIEATGLRNGTSWLVPTTGTTTPAAGTMFSQDGSFHRPVDTWSASTAYGAGYLAAYNNSVYSCATAHTNQRPELSVTNGVQMWKDSTAAASSSTAGALLELGLRFVVNYDGFVTKLRVYKASGYTPDAGGLYLALWTTGGTQLVRQQLASTVTSAAGWFTLTLSTPIAVTKNSQYIVSYSITNAAHKFSVSVGFIDNDTEVNQYITPLAGASIGNVINTFPSGSNSNQYYADVSFQPTPSAISMYNEAVTTTPVSTSSGAGIELGLRFTPLVDCVVTKIKWYKVSGANFTGGRYVAVWSGSGTKLIRFQTGTETTSGWQTATLATPLALTAKTDYMVSYSSPSLTFPINAGGLNEIDTATRNYVTAVQGIVGSDVDVAPSSSFGNTYYVYPVLIPASYYGVNPYWTRVSRGNPSFPTGSIPFGNRGNLDESNSRLYWDTINDRLGVGTNAPTTTLEVAGGAKVNGALLATLVSSDGDVYCGATSSAFRGYAVNVTGPVAAASLSTSGNIYATGNVSTNGYVNTNYGLFLSTPAATAAGGANSPLNLYEEHTATVALINGATGSYDIKFVRVNKLVTLVFPTELATTSGTADFITSNDAIPARFTPPQTVTRMTPVTNNGVPAFGYISIGDNSFFSICMLTLSGTALSLNTSFAGTRGWKPFSVSYLV